jgi:hypothetical protein
MRSAFVTLSVVFFAAACGGAQESTPAAESPQRACAGLSDDVVDRGLAELRANVERGGQIREQRSPKALPVLTGAVVEVSATPSMTAPWLGRLLWCDSARNGAAALVPTGARSDVSPTTHGFAISVRASTSDLAREIDRRARLFVHPEGGCAWDDARTCAAGPSQGTAR